MEAVKTLVLNGEDLNSKDKSRSNQTPLHVAAREGHLEIVKFLVESGADIFSKDNANQTPVVWAKRCRNTLVEDFLSQFENSVESSNHPGFNSIFNCGSSS